MSKSITALTRFALVLVLCVLPATGCPAPGGKLLPLASERVRVVFHEDTEMTGESTRDGITVAASGIWSPGGTDVVLDVHNTSGEDVQVDFGKVKLTNAGGVTASLLRLVEYARRGDNKQQTLFLYEREKTEGQSAVVRIAAGSQRRLQAGFSYQSTDSAGGKLGDKATLEVPVELAAGKPPNVFDFAFEYKGK